MEPGPARTSPWSLRDPLFIYLGALAAAVVALLVAGAVGFVDIDNIESDEQLPRLIMVTAAAQFLAMLAGLQLLSVRKGTGNFREDFQLRVSASDLPYLLYGAGLLFLFGLAMTLILSLIGVDPPTQEVVEAARASKDLAEKAVIVAVIAILAPVLEEILFRGVLQDALKARLPVTGAVWLTGIVFGVVHLADPATLALVPALIVLGVVLGFVREKAGGSLSRPILMHIGFNAVTAVALAFSL